MPSTTSFFCSFVTLCLAWGVAQAGNPVIKDRFTADPAALVHEGTVYLYVGHDEATPEDRFFVLNEWLIYASTDLIHWELKGSLDRAEFEWGRRATAWAAQAVERDGKFYWYVTVLNDDPDPAKAGFGIGVAVAGSPIGPFRDALGEPLVRSDRTTPPAFMVEGGRPSWDNIDPAVFIDADGSVEDGVSIQSENMPGFYLVRVDNHAVRLTKHDGSEAFAQAATFVRSRGLAKRDAVSFAVPGERQNYLLVSETGALMHQRVTRVDRDRATFVLSR